MHNNALMVLTGQGSRDRACTLDPYTFFRTVSRPWQGSSRPYPCRAGAGAGPMQLGHEGIRNVREDALLQRPFFNVSISLPLYGCKCLYFYKDIHT